MGKGWSGGLWKGTKGSAYGKHNTPTSKGIVESNPATQHGTQRLTERGFTPNDISLTKSTNIIKAQADGAKVYIKDIGGGRFNVIVEGDRGIITALKNISQKSLDRLSKNYKWR